LLLHAVAVGGVATVIAPWYTPWQLAVLVVWDTTAAYWLVGVWRRIRSLDAEGTETLATREDPGRVSAHLLLIVASVTSLVGVGLALIEANRSTGWDRALLTIAAVVSVAASWVVVHTVFTLHYAREYYTSPRGGIDFKNDAPPDYQDFAYVAFTVGMTFQVSDTDVQDRTIRRRILRQALLAYLFGAVILAVTINVVAGLIR
jgi:uncharacterized membrane protein